MGGCLPAALLCLQWRWALPWAMLLLLVSSQLQVTHSWTSQDERKNDDQNVMESYFPATVEYALYIFNQNSKDMNAYRLVRILNSWKEQSLHRGHVPLHLEHPQNVFISKDPIQTQREAPHEVETMMAFSMELELRRTRCEKLDDDIDNCPFQESPELNNTFTCFFTISTEPWRTMFQLLNKTCLEGFH